MHAIFRINFDIRRTISFVTNMILWSGNHTIYIYSYSVISTKQCHNYIAPIGVGHA